MKILFMEDEPTIREVLTEYMKMQNYEVSAVGDGQEALRLLDCEVFDMAVLDIMVPHINGLEVLSHIQKNYPATAVIMLTALNDEATQLQAFNHYADDYVVKPVSPIILLKRMETIFRRSRHLAADSLPAVSACGSRLSISEEGYLAYYDGIPLKLTLSEFLLLQVLFREPRRVFTREDLILKIFNEDYIGNDRIIDAHVKNLRKKLPENMIKTVIGVGYQFNS